jgi:hypothetical protein
MRASWVVGETGRWRGVVIPEGLHDPALINDLRVTRAFITEGGLRRRACRRFRSHRERH